MNIIVRTAEGKVYCRPDTTWERENKDLFVPDEVAGYSYAPVVFAKVSKAGKCVAEKFAERYYDSIGFGVLLYVGDDIASGSCYDRSSILPTLLKDKSSLTGSASKFSFMMDEKEIFGCESGTDTATAISKAIACCSKIVSMRIGDYVAIELQERKALTQRSERSIRISGTLDGDSLFDFNMVF